VRSFDGYCKLSKRNLDELEAGARVEPGDRKKDPLDFALWKAAKPASRSGTARGARAGPAGTSNARR
jgi:cysteinyl-tRNA synthetase